MANGRYESILPTTMQISASLPEIAKPILGIVDWWHDKERHLVEKFSLRPRSSAASPSVMINLLLLLRQFSLHSYSSCIICSVMCLEIHSNHKYLLCIVPNFGFLIQSRYVFSLSVMSR